MRMIDRVHRDTANSRSLTQPARSGRPCQDSRSSGPDSPLARSVAMTFNVNLAHFTGRHFHLGVFAFLGHQLGCASSRASQLRAFPSCAFRYCESWCPEEYSSREEHCPPGCLHRPGNDRGADLQPMRMNNVALFTVRIVQQAQCALTDSDRTRWQPLWRESHLVALEIDDPIELLVTSPAMAHRHRPILFRPPVRSFGVSKALFRMILGDVFKRRDGL